MEKETKVAAVSMKNITKTFGSVIANDKVNLDIYKGEILSLLGENGSGKTTLMNMLSGIYFPDEGQIFINGKEEVIRSPKDALRLGIGMVHQHFKLIDVLSATENMKNEFISSVSHELRTPLTAIKGWGETLASAGSQDTEMMQKGMRVIIKETERLAQMVEELLDFSRIQSGRLTLVKTKMDILAELEEAVLIYGERAKRENIAFVYHAPEMLPIIFGDKNRLRQVFINIIDNALKYSDSGDTVTVTAKEAEDTIEIIIADTGCGISAVDLPKVKTKFYKANSTRRGSGIGLALANEIVMMHGGELLIDSKENVGTTVTVVLPVNLNTNENKQSSIVTNQRKDQSSNEE